MELFAGVGGFRLGLEKTDGFNVYWGNQWEPSKKVKMHSIVTQNNLKITVYTQMMI